MAVSAFSQIHFLVHQLREPAHLLIGPTTFFVRPLGRTERLQMIAEVNIIIIGIAV